MCEVNEIGAAAEAATNEDDALEKIFSECDVSSTGRVSVTKLIGYMHEHMSSHGSPEILKDLRKSMNAASGDGKITRKQYYDVSRSWLAGLRKRQHYPENYEDGNNNIDVDRNSDNFIEDPVEPAINGRFGITTQVRTTLVLAEPADDLHADTEISGSQLDAESFQGFLDVSTSTVVDTAESATIPDPFFGDLSSVDGTYHNSVHDQSVVETTQDLRQRAQRCAIDNEHLREELQRAEDSIAALERQLVLVRRRMELANSRYERLHGEHEEHKELLATAERDRDLLEAKNHRLEKENSVLRKEIQSAEIEARRLNVDLDNANEEKEKRNKLLAQYQQELIERQTLYDEARGEILQMELTTDQLREKYNISASTTEHLRVIVKELETRISELQPNQNYILHGERLFTSSSSDNGLDTEADIFQESEITMPCSLRDEMKATGYSDAEESESVRYLNDKIDDQNLNNSEYIEAVLWATEELKRGAVELIARQTELETRKSSARIAEARNQFPEIEEHCSSIEDLRRFKSQVRHVLTIFSRMASRKVTIADTKDAMTQLDRLDSVSELPAICNIDTGITGYPIVNNNNNNNNSDTLCSTCRRKNRPCKEVKVDTKIVRSSSPLFPSLDVCLSSEITSTPCSSSSLNSPPISSGLARDRPILIPNVTALDEIIQDTYNSNSSSNSSESEPSMGTRRERNPRYVYTLPSSRPSESGDDPVRGADSSLVAMPSRDVSQALSQSPGRINLDQPKSESESSSDVSKSYAWRCQESTTTDETSDDTYGTGSSKTRSIFAEGASSSRLKEDERFKRTRDIANAAELTLSNAIQNQGFDRDKTGEDCNPDVVEGLNSDLEKLTLRTGASAEKHKAVNTGYQKPTRTIDTHDQPPEMTSGEATGNQAQVKIPKRKSSVYQRSFDYYSRLEVGQKTTVRKATGSAIVQESIISDDTSLRKRDSNANLHRAEKSDDLLSEELTREITNFSGHRVDSKNDQSEQSHYRTTYDNKLVELDVQQPRENSAGPSITTTTMSGWGLRDISDETSRPPTLRSIKSEVSLGNRWSEYAISGIWNRPRSSMSTSTSTSTPRFPPSISISNNFALVDAAERRSDDCEIRGRSRSVARAMSSEEDSSDSECARDRIDREEEVQVSALPLPRSSLSPTPSLPVTQSVTPTSQQQQTPTDFSFVGRYGKDIETRIAGESDENFQRPSTTNQRLHRSLSESDTGPCRGNAKYRCTCRWNEDRNRIVCAQGGDVDGNEDLKNQQSFGVFPSLPDARLIELGLVRPVDGFDPCERMDAEELERKYTALSIGLGTDRVTLPRRLALSLRQRDQAERNLATEVERMQRDIQALAPLCVDRESIERVERVRHQLEMISRCALRVSCTAELLGATHQERRVSRAALLADRYLQALRTRSDKLVAELAETKRILNENNIVIEESSGELNDDVVPRVRYRGVPPTNRTTMSRRRASIATISRPVTVNPLQEAIKDPVRQQRTSVPARMSLRRPSLGYDTQRWDNEKLDRTDSSSSSIGELREIFEQAESRRGSREENNNLIRCSQSSNFSVGSCESGDSDVWASTREDTFSFQAQARDEDSPAENRLLSRKTPQVFRTMQERVSRLPISWYILFVAVFFFGFYSNRFVTTRSTTPLKWWSVDEIMKRYVHVQRNMPPPL